MKTILFLFNSSDYGPAPWLAAGYRVVSVDCDDTDHASTLRARGGHPYHHRLNIDLSRGPCSVAEINDTLEHLGYEDPSFIVSYAPCTDLAVCGNRSRIEKLKRDGGVVRRAVVNARLVEHWTCPSIVENPVSILATHWKRPTGYVHPWQFSGLCPEGPHPEFPDLIPERDLYPKKTGLWCQNGALLPVPVKRDPPAKQDFFGYAKLGGKSARTKYIRSLSPRGMSEAIFLANHGIISQN